MTEQKVVIEPENTLIGKFQKERTDAISEMFYNRDKNGIYPTTKFFIRLDNFVRELLTDNAGEIEQAVKKERERIILWMNEYCYEHGEIRTRRSNCKWCRQALKGDTT